MIPLMNPGGSPLKQNAKQYKDNLLFDIFGAQPQAIGAPALPPVPPHNNIVGVGFGAKLTVGQAQQDTAVRVYVRAKMPLAQINQKERIPNDINGLPTDVIAVGDIEARGMGAAIQAGSSIGHFRITAGTLGCYVKDMTGRKYVLSNNHVLADSNAGNSGDDIYQPGPFDGGTPPAFARLSNFKQIVMGGAPNDMDAAIAEVISDASINPHILTIGAIGNNPSSAQLYQSVRKHGRTTLHTIGVVMDIAADIWVGFGNQRAWFEDQIAVQGVGSSNFSAGGDSGSLIVDAISRDPVALLFAGGAGTTFGNPILPVLAHFGVQII